MNPKKNETGSATAPLISVIMAVYNSGQYLPVSIESVLSQTYRYFELIIINDGSTDGSEAIIQKYAAQDGRIVYLKNNTNLRQSETRNRGIRRASGKYIVIVDSDDICLSGRFREQVSFLEEHKNIDVLGSSYCLFSDNKGDECQTVVSAHAHDLYDATPPVHNPTCIIRKEIFLNHGYYDSKYDHAEDYELWVRWSAQGVLFDNLPRVLYKKRTHAGSVSVSHIKRQIYLMLKVDMKALFQYRVRFTFRGYLHILEQFLYLVYLAFGLNKIYSKGKPAN